MSALCPSRPIVNLIFWGGVFVPSMVDPGPSICSLNFLIILYLDGCYWVIEWREYREAFDSLGYTYAIICNCSVVCLIATAYFLSLGSALFWFDKFHMIFHFLFPSACGNWPSTFNRFTTAKEKVVLFYALSFNSKCVLVIDFFVPTT
jgi:hypothetical protein